MTAKHASGSVTRFSALSAFAQKPIDPVVSADLALPTAVATYAFDSPTLGTAGPQSEMDLAVLVACYADPLVLWDTAGNLEDVVCCPVDLPDLRAASTVMQYHVITTGQRLWSLVCQPVSSRRLC